MLFYIIKRLIFIIPTLLLIILLNFVIVQFAPGGPVENTLSALRGLNQGGEGSATKRSITDNYKAARGMEDEMKAYLNKLYGFDLPPYQRFLKMLGNYLKFDFGNSYYKNKSVLSLIGEKLPISLSLGLWSTILIYLISIPLGISKAVRNGEKFDYISSFIVAFLYSIPSFLFAILLISFLSADGLITLFPIGGLVSYNFDQLTWYQKILDYMWHMVLPTLTLTLAGIAPLVLLTKNCFLEEINKQYVLTARAKGLSENKVLYGHVFRNAMLIVIAGIPDTLIKIIFTGTLLMEIVFSLSGLGHLGYESVINRDYPVVFGTLYIFTFIGLLSNLITDVCYTLIDPRINYDQV